MDEICVKEGVPYLGVIYDPLTLELEALPIGSLGAQKEVYLHWEAGNEVIPWLLSGTLREKKKKEKEEKEIKEKILIKEFIEKNAKYATNLDI